MKEHVNETENVNVNVHENANVNMTVNEHVNVNDNVNENVNEHVNANNNANILRCPASLHISYQYDLSVHALCSLVPRVPYCLGSLA